jgi:phosphoserine aminotransferase
MPATYEPIATQTASGSTSSITFSSIPQTYTDLVIVKNGGNTAVSNSRFQFNGDTGNNYSQTGLYGSGSVAQSYRETSVSAVICDYFSTTGQRSMTVIQLLNYSNSATYKSGIYRRNDTYNGTLANAFLWRSTSAITSVTFSVIASGNFDSTTTFTLYGIKAA